jgi:transposase
LRKISTAYRETFLDDSRFALEALPALMPSKPKIRMVGMEASNGAHYWARLLTELGHKVRLISPQFVAPYVKSNKNARRLR